MHDAPAKSLHQDLILQHYRNSRHRGPLEAPDAEAAVENPTCGDVVTLRLRMREGRVAQARFGGHGCTISQASASMMTALLEGKSLAEAGDLAARFTALMHGDEQAARDPALGDLRALAGVARFPLRVKCALLAWQALRQAGERLDDPGGGDAPE